LCFVNQSKVIRTKKESSIVTTIKKMAFGLVLAGLSMLITSKSTEASQVNILSFTGGLGLDAKATSIHGNTTILSIGPAASPTIAPINYSAIGVPGFPSGGLYMDFMSTGAATVTGTQLTQSFTGSFIVYDNSGIHTPAHVILEGMGLAATLTGVVGGFNSTLQAQFTNNVFTGSLTNVPGAQWKFPDGFQIAFGQNVKLDLKGATTTDFKATVAGFVQATPVPEPSTMALGGLGLGGLALAAYRRRLAA
jgi:hypothetical protein